MNRLIHYVYVSFRLNGVPFYVGKGTGKRWMRADRHGKHYRNIINISGGKVPIVIVRDELSEEEAYIVEEALIRAIGIERDGGLLINQGYGGSGGPQGVKHSYEWKLVRSQRAKEVWQRPEYRAVILRPGRNRSGNKQPRSESFKRQMSERLKGNSYTKGKILPQTSLSLIQAWKDRPLVWINNGYKRRRCLIEEIPFGWARGKKLISHEMFKTIHAIFVKGKWTMDNLIAAQLSFGC